MWFQVPTPQTTSRSTSSRRSILKRDESLPIAPRDWVSFDATARRSTVPPDTSSRWLVALVHRQAAHAHLAPCAPASDVALVHRDRAICVAWYPPTAPSPPMCIAVYGLCMCVCV